MAGPANESNQPNAVIATPSAPAGSRGCRTTTVAAVIPTVTPAAADSARFTVTAATNTLGIAAGPA